MDREAVHHQRTTPPAGLSAESVDVLLALVDSVTVSMAAPNVVQQVQALAQARNELLALRDGA